MKFIFFGTPDFAAIILKKLISRGYAPAAVVCAPDRPAGRKQILTPPPVKTVALPHHVTVFQPISMHDEVFLDALKNIKPNIFILSAYGKILPKKVLDIPERGTLNIHPSLLPRWRGASPIQAAIVSGDAETGVTIMLMDEEMDHGPILAFRKYPNPSYQIPNESQIPLNKITKEKLEEQLAVMGADALIEVLPGWIAGKMVPQEQNHADAAYCTVIKKEDGNIDWSRNAEEIERMVRAYTPWPGAYTFWQSEGRTKKISILETEVFASDHTRKAGEVFLSDKKNPAVQCGERALRLKQIQLEGRPPVSGAAFLNGHRDFIDSMLGEK